MSPKAKVNSIDAIESFRTHLCIFNDKAEQILNEAQSEVIRTRSWITSSQHPYWRSQIRQRSVRLEEARNELFSARLSGLKGSTAVEERKVRHTEMQLNEAQEKLRMVSKWGKSFDGEAQTCIAKLGRLSSLLDLDTPRAIIQLSEMIKSLQAYAATKYFVEENNVKEDVNEHEIER